MQNHPVTSQKLAFVGEEIGYELGSQMIKNYQAANPNDVKFYTIGRQIIDKILAQPGCEGISFYNAYNEKGEKTLVYVGLDFKGNTILEYTVVNSTGQLTDEKGIVADRVRIPGQIKTGFADADDWGWSID